MAVVDIELIDFLFAGTTGEVLRKANDGIEADTNMELAGEQVTLSDTATVKGIRNIRKQRDLGATLNLRAKVGSDADFILSQMAENKADVTGFFKDASKSGMVKTFTLIGTGAVNLAPWTLSEDVNEYKLLGNFKTKTLKTGG